MGQVVAFQKAQQNELDQGVRKMFITAWVNISDEARTALYAMGADRPEDLAEVKWDPLQGKTTFRGRDLMIEELQSYFEFRCEMHAFINTCFPERRPSYVPLMFELPAI